MAYLLPNFNFLSDMKKHVIGMLALAGMVSAAAHAATVVQSYEEAKDKVSDDGFIVIAYPDGWNRKATLLGKALVSSAEIGKAAGDAVIMALPIPNISGKEVQEARKAQLGPIKVDLGRAHSYPAIYMCESSGRNYAVIPAYEYRTMGKDARSVTDAASVISSRLSAGREQRELMNKANGTQDIAAKAELISKAVSLEGLNRPDKVVELAKKMDPKDTTGLTAALNYNWYGLVWACVKDDWKKGLQQCESLLANPLLSPKQKQLVYLCAMGTLRRHGGAEGMEKMRKYGKEMRALAPDSCWGRSYDGAMRLWDVRFSLESGWNPTVLPAKDEPAECVGPWPISAPGTYKITFRYTGGAHALQVSKVELYDGTVKVAEDAHRSTVGHRLVNNVYTLRVDAPVKAPRVVVTTCMGKNRNSSGTISVSRE